MPPCTNTQGRKTYLDGPTVADFESYWHSKSDEAGCVRMWNGRDLLFQWQQILLQGQCEEGEMTTLY